MVLGGEWRVGSGGDGRWGAGSGGGAKSGAGSTFALSCGRVSKTVDVNPQSPRRAIDFLSASESFGNAPKIWIQAPQVTWSDSDSSPGNWTLTFPGWRKRRRGGVRRSSFRLGRFGFVMFLRDNSYWVCKHYNCHARADATTNLVKWILVWNAYVLGTLLHEIWGWCWASDDGTSGPDLAWPSLPAVSLPSVL